MAQILVRDLDKKVVESLKSRARERGRSLQSEVKTILSEAAVTLGWIMKAQSSVWPGFVKNSRAAPSPTAPP